MIFCVAINSVLAAFNYTAYGKFRDSANILAAIICTTAVIFCSAAAVRIYKRDTAPDLTKPIMVTTEAPIKVDSITSITNGRTFYLHYFGGGTYKLGNEFIEDLQ